MNAAVASSPVDIGAASTSGEARNEALRKAAGLAPTVGVAESAQTAMIKNDPLRTVTVVRYRESLSANCPAPLSLTGRSNDC
jgi:hypothetical protein